MKDTPVIPVIARNLTIKTEYRARSDDVRIAVGRIYAEIDAQKDMIQGRSHRAWWTTAVAAKHASLKIEAYTDDEQCPNCGNLRVDKQAPAGEAQMHCKKCNWNWDCDPVELNNFPEMIEGNMPRSTVPRDKVESAIDALIGESQHSNAGLLGRAMILLSWIKGESKDLSPKTREQVQKWLDDVKEHQEAENQEVFRKARGVS